MTVRTFVSAVGVILALLLTAVAVPAAWVDTNVVKEDGFVRMAAALGNDPGFQQRLAAAAAGTFESSVPLPEPVRDLAAGAIKDAASGMQSWSDYPQAWEETARNSHRLNFGTVQTEEAQSPTALQLDIAPLVRLIRDHFASSTGIRLDVPEQSVVTLGQPAQRQVIERVSAFAPLWWVAAVGAVLSALLVLAAARRRAVVLTFLGLGGLTLAAVWTTTADIAVSAAQDLSSGNSVAELFKEEFLASARSGFGEWIAASIWASGGMLALGVIAWLLTGRGRSRSADRSGTGR
ncbi:hypothetical protein ACKLTP_09890 [Paenarthrobacter ureafaciens]|uniref:hypothetical protein n=1 Tax=Paenarthrobacter TaxID=1742992 RepID=UPI00222FC9BA|nr:hypothetical protein [Paenarthrobacter sp. PAE-2]MCW3765802.1 hypothetical protein [Paenarthrobacter sp. PAE-2]